LFAALNKDESRGKFTVSIDDDHFPRADADAHAAAAADATATPHRPAFTDLRMVSHGWPFADSARDMDVTGF